MRADRLRYEAELRILLLMNFKDLEMTMEKALCLDFICRNPSYFQLDGYMMEGDNPLIFGQFMASIKTFRNAVIDLVARKLIIYSMQGNQMKMHLSPTGFEKADALNSEYAREYKMRAVKVLAEYGDKSSEYLSDLINKKASEAQYEK